MDAKKLRRVAETLAGMSDQELANTGKLQQLRQAAQEAIQPSIPANLFDRVHAWASAPNEAALKKRAFGYGPLPSLAALLHNPGNYIAGFDRAGNVIAEGLVKPNGEVDFNYALDEKRRAAADALFEDIDFSALYCMPATYEGCSGWRSTSPLPVWSKSVFLKEDMGAAGGTVELDFEVRFKEDSAEIENASCNGYDLAEMPRLSDASEVPAP